MIQPRGLRRIWIVAALGLAAFLMVAAQGKYEKGEKTLVWTHVSASGGTDSQYSYDTTPGIEIKGWSSAQVKFTIKVDTSTAGGQGLKDTGVTYVETFRCGAWAKIDSLFKAAGAPAWSYTKRWHANIGDTLLGESLRFITIKIDTIQDSIITLHDSGAWEWVLK